MNHRSRTVKTDQPPDPFHERTHPLLQVVRPVMGAKITFESDSRRLLELVRVTYDGLPQHRLPGPQARLRIRLIERDADRDSGTRRGEPPELAMFSGAGWLGGVSKGSDMVIISPRERSALVAVSPQTLRSPYHTRYELIEFAVFTLAARSQRLSPLHSACVGKSGRGVLLMGPSGSGKSTVTLMAVMSGLEFLSEDAVFVAPGALLATGVSNYLHVRTDSLHWLSPAQRRLLRASPVIRRRSGVSKFELDLRRGGYRLASSALKITAVVFLSARSAAGRDLLRPLSRTALRSTFAANQAYAVNQPNWPAFSTRLARFPAYELRRGRHPDESVEALRSLLPHR
ncbi:MAG TPA: hypothetical protein VNZ06_02645 [Steroidobacteraceae bacterium]|jgi:hypothetical protein|nr:hypothetical protein [Steroidobacteraceae bacterium]